MLMSSPIFLMLFLSFHTLVAGKYTWNDSVFLHFYDLFYGLSYDQCWRKFWCAWECITCCHWVEYSVCVFWFHLDYSSAQSNCFLTNALCGQDDLFLVESGLLKSLIITILLSISLFRFFILFYILLGTYYRLLIPGFYENHRKHFIVISAYVKLITA
jgi:hypothetical protein